MVVALRLRAGVQGTTADVLGIITLRRGARNYAPGINGRGVGASRRCVRHNGCGVGSSYREPAVTRPGLTVVALDLEKGVQGTTVVASGLQEGV